MPLLHSVAVYSSNDEAPLAPAPAFPRRWVRGFFFVPLAVVGAVRGSGRTVDRRGSLHHTQGMDTTNPEGAAKRSRPRHARTALCIRLPPEMAERLRMEADARAVSVNWMVTKALEDFLPRLIPVDEMKWTR